MGVTGGGSVLKGFLIQRSKDGQILPSTVVNLSVRKKNELVRSPSSFERPDKLEYFYFHHCCHVLAGW